KSDEPLNIFNVETVIKKHEQWLKLMPRVRPYYAVKCNPYKPLLRLLYAMGCGFDCASQHEIETVLSIGTDPDSIVYANPNKTDQSLVYSRKMDIKYMAVDGQEELLKINRLYPGARPLFRLKVDDTGSHYRLGEKFGATLTECRQMFRLCSQLAIRPAGVAFHVGVYCQSAESYFMAIEMARQVFDMAAEMGFAGDIHVLDLGGGFPGTDRFYFDRLATEVSSFSTVAQAINQALDRHFPNSTGSSTGTDIRIIAEPGTYYAAAAFQLLTRIIAKRMVYTDQDINHNHSQPPHAMYYLNDGVFGSFNMSAMMDAKRPPPIPVLPNGKGARQRQSYRSTLWGPSLTSLDCIVRDIQMPELDIGDHLLFEDMGAYTSTYSPYGFNGMPNAQHCIHLSGYVQDKYRKIF
ncbi:antizyme inhibitor 2-like, partial [Oppia nitens]|uniref:antizyme inhibitor 2-like n=1 Tax=Oppia nitens TaxID=1686743 RepID=UPI0023DCC846